MHAAVFRTSPECCTHATPWIRIATLWRHPLDTCYHTSAFPAGAVAMRCWRVPNSARRAATGPASRTSSAPALWLRPGAMLGSPSWRRRTGRPRRPARPGARGARRRRGAAEELEPHRGAPARRRWRRQGRSGRRPGARAARRGRLQPRQRWHGRGARGGGARGPGARPRGSARLSWRRRPG